jgi:hypothetical protein
MGIIGKITLIIHWYYKTTYIVVQNIFAKRLIIKDEGTTLLNQQII